MNVRIAKFDVSVVTAPQRLVDEGTSVNQVYVAQLPAGVLCAISAESVARPIPLKFVGQELNFFPSEDRGIFFLNTVAQVGTVILLVFTTDTGGTSAWMRGAGSDPLTSYANFASGSSATTFGLPVQLFNPAGSGVLLLAPETICSAERTAQLNAVWKIANLDTVLVNQNASFWLDRRQPGTPKGIIAIPATQQGIAGLGDQFFPSSQPIVYPVRRVLAPGQGVAAGFAVVPNFAIATAQAAVTWHWQEVAL